MTASPPHTTAMQRDTQFRKDVVALIPHLRAFARSLCAGRPIAEDIAQETLMKALRAQDRFTPGTNLKAWLFTILRNEYYSIARRSWRQTTLEEGKMELIPAPQNQQEWTAELSDLTRALATLSDGQRETLILVGAGGFTHKETAEICGIAVGTVKSRVARGRNMLIEILDGEHSMPKRPAARMTEADSDIQAQLRLLTSVMPAGMAMRAAA